MELGLLRLPSAGLPLGGDFSMDLDLIVPDWLPELPKELPSLGAPAAPTPGKSVPESASPKGPLHLRLSSGGASDSGSEEAGPAEDDGDDCEDGPSARSKSTSLTSQDSEAAARVRRSARLHGTAAACHLPKVRCLCCNGRGQTLGVALHPSPVRQAATSVASAQSMPLAAANLMAPVGARRQRRSARWAGRLRGWATPTRRT